MVDHNILLDRLENEEGFSGTVPYWSEFFLKDSRVLSVYTVYKFWGFLCSTFTLAQFMENNNIYANNIQVYMTISPGELNKSTKLKRSLYH